MFKNPLHAPQPLTVHIRRGAARADVPSRGAGPKSESRASADVALRNPVLDLGELGRKYAYTYIDESPSGYFESFTLVLRSDLCDVFFDKVRVFRKRFQPEWNYPLFRELKVDCAGEHISTRFQEGCIENDIALLD